MSEEQAKYKTPFDSPNADLARRLMNHFSVCRPLMSDVELEEIKNHSDDIEAKWDAYGDSNDQDRYDEILEEELKSPHLDKQQNSYEAFLDSVIKNFPELNGVHRQDVSDTLIFYFEYYFGEGGANSSETAGIIYSLDKVLPSSNIVK